MDLLKPVSGRQFAKMVGQSEGAVRKAISRCSIVEGLTADKKIIPITASNEWGKAILPEFLKAPVKKVIEKPAVIKSKPAPIKKPTPVKSVVTKPTPKLKIVTVKPKPSKSVKKEKPEPSTADEVLEEVMSEKLPKISDDDLEKIDDADPEEASDHIGKPEAERQAAIIKVKILRLAYMEKRGQMVPVTKVNTVLFGYGMEIRNAVEGITNRAIDKIMATNSRHDAKRILDEEIYDTLNLLADITTREFK